MITNVLKAPVFAQEDRKFEQVFRSTIERSLANIISTYTTMKIQLQKWGTGKTKEPRRTVLRANCMTPNRKWAHRLRSTVVDGAYYETPIKPRQSLLITKFPE